MNVLKNKCPLDIKCKLHEAVRITTTTEEKETYSKLRHVITGLAIRKELFKPVLSEDRATRSVTCLSAAIKYVELMIPIFCCCTTPDECGKLHVPCTQDIIKSKSYVSKPTIKPQKQSSSSSSNSSSSSSSSSSGPGPNSSVVQIMSPQRPAASPTDFKSPTARVVQVVKQLATMYPEVKKKKQNEQGSGTSSIGTIVEAGIVSTLLNIALTLAQLWMEYLK